ncbi:hypothetical protein ACFORL_11880 [Legionella dresdenensis]|uniref:Uncharacterized protein n=1 Tax=Legionella dresdenensis TaxID=450200 RepID=A0ABV8CIC4_9GAMM
MLTRSQLAKRGIMLVAAVLTTSLNAGAPLKLRRPAVNYCPDTAVMAKALGDKTLMNAGIEWQVMVPGEKVPDGRLCFAWAAVDEQNMITCTYKLLKRQWPFFISIQSNQAMKSTLTSGLWARGGNVCRSEVHHCLPVTACPLMDKK